MRMCSKRSAGIVLAMLLTVAIAACGGAGSGDRSTAAAARGAKPASAAASDRALAARALVRLTDFPRTWEAEATPVTNLRCNGLDPFRGASVLLGTHRLTKEAVGVQETIAVFPTVATARRAYVRINSHAAMTCLRRDVRRRVTREAGGPAQPPRLVRIERVGADGIAKRFTSSAIAPYGPVTGYIDAVHLRARRSLAALVLVSGLAPTDEALYERVVQLMARRLRATLG
jgi:hypothetical protein